MRAMFMLDFADRGSIIKGEPARCANTLPALTKRKKRLCGWLKTKIPILTLSFKLFLHPSCIAPEARYKPAQAGIRRRDTQ